MKKKSLFQRIGPAFIVGACVIGPGSVTLMSTTGANYGYTMLWLSLLSGGLMAGFLAIFMRFGILSDTTFLDAVTQKFGRWYAVLCGVSIFLVSAAFQFGNALGVTAGMGALTESLLGEGKAPTPFLWPVLFSTAALVFLFAFKRIYGVLEKLMTFFLVFMALAFIVNLAWAGPDWMAALRGACVPSIPGEIDLADSEATGAFWVTIGGLVATTFVISAAFIQPYLVKAKGWTEEDLGNGLADTVLASIMLTLVGSVIMMTAAAALYPREGTVNFAIMISQLEDFFGGWAAIIFSVGFFCAAFSSFITNSLIGGVLLNDGLGFGGKLESMPTKVFAAGVLLVGMTTGMFIIHTEQKANQAAEVAAATAEQEEADQQPADQSPAEKPEKKGIDLKIGAIRVGQASTLLAIPLAAIAMVVVLFDSRLTKGRALPIWTKAFVVFGALVLIGIAFKTYVTIAPELKAILGFG